MICSKDTQVQIQASDLTGQLYSGACIAGWVPPSIGLKPVEDEEDASAHERSHERIATADDAAAHASAESAEYSHEGSKNEREESKEEDAAGTPRAVYQMLVSTQMQDNIIVGELTNPEW